MLFEGPIDTAVDDRVADELVATLREALSNVARHAHASRLEVEVTVGNDVCLRVADDGVGPPDHNTPKGHGIGNMAARAAKLGGVFALQPGSPSGTTLIWRVPTA